MQSNDPIQPDPAKQREFATRAVERLRQAGHIAYWAGGCVRDQVLGRVPKDYDVATSAQPEAVRQLFGPRRTYAIGAAFGVITVVGPPGAGQVEVATFRRDVEYRDGRRPEAVVFSEPREDALRRDFTINGLFYDPATGEVIDYVGGQADLAARVVRAIGDPRARFAEDKLRMLRAVRFAATFDFALDPAAGTAVRDMARQIEVVSAERVAHEMRLMLVSPGRVRALELLAETGLLEVTLPEVAALRGVPQHKPLYPQHDLWDHTLLVLGLLRKPTFELALAALLHDAGKPRAMSQARGKLTFYEHETIGATIAARLCQRWRLSTRERQQITWLVRHHQYLSCARQMRWATLQRTLTHAGVAELLDLHEADALASTGDTADVEYCRHLLQMPLEDFNPPALVTGHDLIRHGLSPGKQFQRLLDLVRDAQLEKRIRSKRDALALVDELLRDGVPPADAAPPVDKPDHGA
jgi:poly(A) polymerase